MTRRAGARDRRRAAARRGGRAETVAAWWLRLRGYRILARGFRAPVGEIDLIAKRGRVLAMVEVKARPTLDEARQAISPRQRDRIARAALAFVQRHPVLRRLNLRYDALLLVPGRWPRHNSRCLAMTPRRYPNG